MMRSLFSGVSGLRNHQVRLDAIGNNIANVNTIGFKSTRVNFQEVFSQTLRGASSPSAVGFGGTNPQQVGLGMSVSSIDTIHNQGNLQVTGKMTDMSIQGNGFFILSDGSSKAYTRAGTFDIDAQGSLVNPATGMKVQGWIADAAGNFGVKDESNLQPVKITLGQPINAQATSAVNLSGNLDSSTAVGSSYTTAVEVYDSLGNASTMQITLVKLASGAGAANNIGPNTWRWVADVGGITHAQVTAAGGTGLTTSSLALPANSSLPSGNYRVVVGGAGPYTVELRDSTGVTLLSNVAAGVAANGTVTLNDATTGNPLVTVTLPAAPAAGTANISVQNDFLRFTTTGMLDTSATGPTQITTTTPVSFTPAGAAAVAVTPNFTALTQMAAKSSAQVSFRNGYKMGSLESFSIDSAGGITGIYSNDLTQKIGQVALASFANPGGLLKKGENLYQESNNSGLRQIGESGVGGRGTIAPANLEMSNVDLSSEFTNMIVTQRGFQANTRVITASDQMLQELVNLIR